MTEVHSRWEDDRSALASRVDELTALVAALARVLEASRLKHVGVRVDRLTEDDMRRILDTAAADVVDLRALVEQMRDRLEVAEADLSEARADLASANAASTQLQAAAKGWEQEATALARHRDEVVADLLAVQQGRWMRVGRTLRIVRGQG